MLLVLLILLCGQKGRWWRYEWDKDDPAVLAAVAADALAAAAAVAAGDGTVAAAASEGDGTAVYVAATVTIS